MQNRYAGDIGDFGKLGLLRQLRKTGLSVGVNWYLTPDETHNGDGRHVGYLENNVFRSCDEQMWSALGEIVKYRITSYNVCYTKLLRKINC